MGPEGWNWCPEENMALKQRKLPAGPCTCETLGQLCNSCNHREQVAECVSGLNILFWGFFTWCMELCLEFSPLRLQLICVYQNEVVELGNKHFVLIYLQSVHWSSASP